jgi:hypothetical protein
MRCLSDRNFSRLQSGKVYGLSISGPPTRKGAAKDGRATRRTESGHSIGRHRVPHPRVLVTPWAQAMAPVLRQYLVHPFGAITSGVRSQDRESA